MNWKPRRQFVKYSCKYLFSKYSLHIQGEWDPQGFGYLPVSGGGGRFLVILKISICRWGVGYFGFIERAADISPPLFAERVGGGGGGRGKGIVFSECGGDSFLVKFRFPSLSPLKMASASPSCGHFHVAWLLYFHSATDSLLFWLLMFSTIWNTGNI